MSLPPGQNTALPELDPLTVREVFRGMKPWHPLACVAWDVRSALADLEEQIRAGGPIRPRRVDGLPVTDWLTNADIARLLQLRLAVSRARAA